MTFRNRMKRVLLAPIASFAGDARSGRVALTFDDGPHPTYTAEVADALLNAGARATFFLVGKHVNEHPALADRLRSDGHELASHSMTHAEVMELPASALDAEFGAMYSLRHSDGSPVFGNRLLRPPKGAVSLQLAWYCARKGIRMIFWNTDPEDYAAASEAEIVGYFRKHPIQAGDIVLMHDCTPFQAKALPAMLEDLRQRGLQAVTVSELLHPAGHA